MKRLLTRALALLALALPAQASADVIVEEIYESDFVGCMFRLLLHAGDGKAGSLYCAGDGNGSFTLYRVSVYEVVTIRMD